MSGNDYLWETFDGLFKTIHRQGRSIEALEARVVELERRLNEREQLAASPDAVHGRNNRHTGESNDTSDQHETEATAVG